MKFVYQYRTSDNVLHEDIVTASSRESAFTALRARGVRPASLCEAPGFVNKVAKIGKRGVAILILATVAVVGWVTAWQRNDGRRGFDVTAAGGEPRQQVYGDPGVLLHAEKSQWSEVFMSEGDRYLADHAIPGRACHCETNAEFWVRTERAVAEVADLDIGVNPTDLAELQKMVRIVQGMKVELREYLKAGGSIRTYLERVEFRQKAECAVYDRVRAELRCTDDYEVWRKKNAVLRSMGLPMVHGVEQD